MCGNDRILGTRLAKQSRIRNRMDGAFPSVDNVPSNSVCRRAGFTIMDEHTYEYPEGSGSFMRVNDWRIDLTLEQIASDRAPLLL